MKTKGKLIVIEGTDCSGKETQSIRLVDCINEAGGKAIRFSFPMYDTPTGKIIGGPYLGKEEICEGFFPEKATNVDGKVASLYYAADRLYNAGLITEKLKEGYTVVLDRYVESNMAHQGGKCVTLKERVKIWNWLNKLEYGLLKLPKPDYVLILHMPAEITLELKKNRKALDQHEANQTYLKQCEETYLDLADYFGFTVIHCAPDGNLLTIDEVHDKVMEFYNNINKD